MNERYVLGLEEVDGTQVAVVGGKGAHLGGLSRIAGISVPAGFCVTTDAFRRIMAEAPAVADRLDQLSRLDPDDREAIRTLSAEIRRTIEGVAVPGDLAAAITRALNRLGEQAAYAVRSSATAEDLPTASFAGQQDTYLNVMGPAAILQHVSRCWASLFTERAVTYRQRNGIDHRTVHMAVVVQQMVFPHAAGILRPPGFRPVFRIIANAKHYFVKSPLMIATPDASKRWQALGGMPMRKSAPGCAVASPSALTAISVPSPRLT